MPLVCSSHAICVLLGGGKILMDDDGQMTVFDPSLAAKREVAAGKKQGVVFHSKNSNNIYVNLNPY